MTKRPIENSHVVPGTLLVAGEYPGSAPRDGNSARDKKLGRFLDAGVTAFIDLTSPADCLAPYFSPLADLAAKRGLEVTHDMLSIKDVDICDPAHMNRVLDTIDQRIAEGHAVYVHCWGGVGRTGMVVGCWLVRHGQTGADALEQVSRHFGSMSKSTAHRHVGRQSPEAPAQCDVVRCWARHDRVLNAAESIPSLRRRSIRDIPWSMLSPRPDATPELRDRMRGALVGLAVGDAVGTTVEFMPPGTFKPVTDMVGGGPIRLAAGEWTDDTSMALCLADSLIERRSFDARDQMERYLRWRNEGYLSSNGRCFDCGITVGQALDLFQSKGEAFAGSTDPKKAGNGSLMRLAPVPLFFYGRGEDAVALASESSRTTHATPVAVDACRYLAALITGALRGASKEELLSPRYAPRPDYWSEHPLAPAIDAIAAGSFRKKSPPSIRGTGYSADALEAALWAFYHGKDFREGCLLAVNLGDDADTTAALYGQLAGACYGESAIPAEWRAKLAKKPLIDRYAELLFQLSFGGPPAMGARNHDAQNEARRLLADARGDAELAIRTFIEAEERTKEEMGVLAYYTSGPMHAQASRDEILLHLRVALGLSTTLES